MDDVSIHDRREPSSRDRIVEAGSIAGALVACFAFVAILADWIPAKATDVAALTERVKSIENDVSSIRVAQQESLELQLMQRVLQVDEQIAETLDPARLLSLNTTRAELEQRRSKARALINKYIAKDN